MHQSNYTITINSIGGTCPVQAEGIINDKPFYFRSRNQHWYLEIAQPYGDGEILWQYLEQYSDKPHAAGYITKEEAIYFINKAAKIYHETNPPQHI